jgi:thiol-disulfide isomerase/thioredoxin
LQPAFEAEAPDGEDAIPADDGAPQPLPQGVVAGARSASPDAYAPILMSDPEPPNRKPAASRRRISRGDNPAPSPAPANVPTRKDRPTWGQVSFQNPVIPLDETLQRSSREWPAERAKPGRVEGLVANASPPKLLAPTHSTLLKSKTGSTCRFDPSERRIYDFQLPDMQGRMVSLHDFDADLILLDFWGTWCGFCRGSIPHLNELQKTLGGKKLQVIGIACEQVPAKDRAAKVATSVKELGITYPVLVSGMDGTCPVQDALQIQFYPTMVLMDREGRILRREQGATGETLARMDRFIARNLDRPRTNESDWQQAQATGARRR